MFNLTAVQKSLESLERKKNLEKSLEFFRIKSLESLEKKSVRNIKFILQSIAGQPDQLNWNHCDGGNSHASEQLSS